MMIMIMITHVHGSAMTTVDYMEKRKIRPILVFPYHTAWLAVWLSGNALVSINVITLRRARLVPGWVTVFGRVNYLGM